MYVIRFDNRDTGSMMSTTGDRSAGQPNLAGGPAS
jgi:hypothetical protein